MIGTFSIIQSPEEVVIGISGSQMTEVGTREPEEAPKETHWTAGEKADAVVRLLCGESLDKPGWELRVEAHLLQA